MSKKKSQELREAVLAALGTVQDPELHNDLVSLGMIKDLVVEDGRVSFVVELTTPACPMRELIERQAREAAAGVPGVKEVEVRMSSSVPAGGMSRGKELPPIRNAIAIGSGKGGVGKTTVAVNVAVALAKAGACVGLLDADIYGPNIPTMMGVDSLPPAKEGRLVPAEMHGVRVLSIAFLVSPGQPLIWRGPMLHSALRQFITDVAWGELDYLIIDLPPGTGDAALSLSQTLPLTGVVIVTLPPEVSLEDARRGLEMFRTLGVPILGVIENMSHLELPDGSHLEVFGQGGGERLAKQAGVPFLAALPLDPIVGQRGDSGHPVVISDPDSAVGKALIGVAESIAGQVSVHALDSGSTAPAKSGD
ncbi:MAG: Mrp/NBP35 family ATP-binding protein [Anaerolineales bacterium]|jgi:ATP-binding protein involved in chromosome partitioning